MSDPRPYDDVLGRRWVCTSCGEPYVWVSSSWRWNGYEMQHACDGLSPQAGHMKAVLLGRPDTAALCQNGHIRHFLDLCRNAEIGLEADAVKVARAAQTAVLAAYAMGRMS